VFDEKSLLGAGKPFNPKVQPWSRRSKIEGEEKLLCPPIIGRSAAEIFSA
jgi:hypothetical protein